ncbi:MAG: ATP-binding protein [Propionibacteriaceae bacterium]|nr:ATP-binding protein [Propionibacteriaceae bacterium]
MVQVPRSPIGLILPRHIASRVDEALNDTRVVLINGARQSGKSTLVSQIAHERKAIWRSLDHGATRQAALNDPTEFVVGEAPMVIDEIQRVPELLLAIKESVDFDPTPGHFLLTGSSRLLGLRNLPDSLPGRIETIELWPLSQGEIDQQPENFVDDIFRVGPGLDHHSSETRETYIGRLVRGGFPEALVRSGRRRTQFLESYVSDIINRDVIQLSSVERGHELRTLVRLLAARSGQLLVPGTLAGELGISAPTVNRYLALLEEVFLIKRIPAWSRNLKTRAIGTSKVAFVDSGIAASQTGQSESSLLRITSPLGGLLEGFVTMEIARQLTWSEHLVDMFHYRTKDKVEVDIVLENRQGQVVAIEVKASSTVRGEDFAGIKHLAARLGDDLVCGLVLYTGQETLPFGPRYRAMPISSLWSRNP